MRDYNFFEDFSGEEKSSGLKNFYVGIGTAVVVGIMVVVYLVNLFRIQGLKSSISSMEDKINSKEFVLAYKEKTENEKKLNILNDYYKASSAVNEAVDNDDYIDSKFINIISNEVPQNISFQNMSVSNKNITISGTADTRVAVGELEHNLKELGMFKDVHVSDISSNSEDESKYSFNFNITFQLKEEQ